MWDVAGGELDYREIVGWPVSFFFLVLTLLAVLTKLVLIILLNLVQGTENFAYI